MNEDQELEQRAAAWGMSAKALAHLLKCGKGSLAYSDEPENHHLRFEAHKIFLRVRINHKHIEEPLPPDLAQAREARDKRLKALGFNHHLFFKNRDAYNARRKSK